MKKYSLANNIQIFVIMLLAVSFFTALLFFSDQIIDYEYLQNSGKWAALYIAIYKTQSYIYGIISIVCFIASLFLLFGVKKIILNPLKKFSSAIEEFSQEKRVRLDFKDAVYEIEKLSESFNNMADRIEDLKKARKVFLSMIAHELYTPLTTLRGNLEAIQEGVFNADEKIEILIDETIYMQRLINDLRQLALAEAGELLLNKTKTDINTHIRRAVQMLEPLFNEKKILLEVKLGNLSEVEVDIDRFNQIIYNLVTNSIKYTPEGGKIIVLSEEAFFENKKWVKISVIDNGPGIDKEHLPFIFEHFYRVEASRSKESGGSGLGLAIVKRLAEAHNGKAVVESVPGEGSKFFIYLPLS